MLKFLSEIFLSVALPQKSYAIAWPVSEVQNSKLQFNSGFTFRYSKHTTTSPVCGTTDWSSKLKPHSTSFFMDSTSFLKCFSDRRLPTR